MHDIASAVKNHRLYAGFEMIQKRLAKHQFVCWIAGGAVRDLILGREVSEFDLVTDASTEILKVLFPQAVLVGESFGVLKVPAGPDSELYDLATFREESDYKDGRRPSKVSSSTPVFDAQRRDLTVNALYWDNAMGVVRDYVGGQFELKAGVLQTVGNPVTRFEEDYLRILRLARFSAQLGFGVELTTERAAMERISSLARISGERVWSELQKIEKHHVWPAALRSSLLVHILESVLGVPVDAARLRDLKRGPMLSTEAVLALIVPEQDLSSVLRERLKVSKNSLDNYQKLKLLLIQVVSKPIFEIFYDLEKSEKLREAWDQLVELGLIEEKLDQELQNVLKMHPASLISASDIMNLVPAQRIGSVLKAVRLKQWSEEISNLDQALDYVKKKYASESEKP
jgi:tRNA nucleotidyltransferase/poly(A) polymerase